jgi:hydroxymethylpyrimidine/phosphomethylpyrimidine kinase
VTPVALTIAGSDPSGGAGLQADLKTFHRFGVYGESVITLITAQNTQGVSRVEVLSPDLVRDQMRAVLSDIVPGAAKTGALGNWSVVDVIAELAEEFTFPLVVDPVLVSSRGTPLLDEEGRVRLAERLLPRAYLLTPNLAEASALSGLEVEDLASMRQAAEVIASLGPRNVLIKGGHLKSEAVDILLLENGKVVEFYARRITTRHTHGTGCSYAAAITAELAKGTQLEEAVGRAKRFITEAIRQAPGLGTGFGPLNHSV